MKLKFQISEGNGYSINDVGNIAIGKGKKFIFQCLGYDCNAECSMNELQMD